MVELLNEYRIYIDVDLVFDSQADFLYRQKGQLKLDNSVIRGIFAVAYWALFDHARTCAAELVLALHHRFLQLILIRA